MSSTVRLEVVASGSCRELTELKGRFVRVLLEAPTWSDDISLDFIPHYGVRVSTGGDIYPTSWFPSDRTGAGLLVSCSKTQVLVPLPERDWPAVRVFDKRGRPVPFEHQVVEARGFLRLASLGRAALWLLLAAVLILLAGCSVLKVELPYHVPEAKVAPLETSVAFPSKRDRTRLYEYAEANNPGLQALRAAHKQVLLGNRVGVETVKRGMTAPSAFSVEGVPIGAIVGAVVSAIDVLLDLMSGKQEIEVELLRAQYEQARLAVVHALALRLDEVASCWDELDTNEARLLDARADYASTKLLVERGLLAGADAHKELAQARDRTELLEDEREKTRQRRLRLTNEALALLGMNPWEGR